MGLWDMSLSGAMLILAIVFIRALALHRLPKTTFPVLWGVALCRLLIPFSIPSRLSIYTAADLLNGLLSKGASGTGAPPVVMAIPGPGTAAGAMQSMPAAAADAGISPIIVVWLIGLSVCALFFLVTHLRWRREYRAALPVENAFVEQWLAEHPIRRTIRVLQSDKIAAPLTYGLFRPVVLLPKATDWTDDLQLRVILTHEFVHIRRFDIVAKWLLAAALCVHWFNPLVWVMVVLANRDIELSCDEAVVRTLGETMKSAYALTLIGLEERKSGLAPLVNHFSKQAIEERIVSIMKLEKASRLGIILALVLVLGVTTAFTTNAAKPDSDEAPSSATGEIGVRHGGAADMEQKAATKEMMAAYEPFGLVYDEETDTLLFHNEVVRDFFDEQAGIGRSMTEGVVDVYPVYEDGKLVGLDKLSQEEFDRKTEEKAARQKDMDETAKALGIPPGTAFAYAGDPVGNVQITSGAASASVMSYTDEAGNVRVSTDEGKTWMSEDEFNKAHPTPDVVWWTYDEYKAWLDNEKIQLQNIIGERAWNQTDGWYVWTQEMVDKTIAMYEGILEDIKNGTKLSKTVDGSSDVMISYNPGEIATTSAFTAAFTDDNGKTAIFGPYDTKEKLLAELKPYCEQQVSAGSMTQQEADELLSKYQ